MNIDIYIYIKFLRKFVSLFRFQEWRFADINIQKTIYVFEIVDHKIIRQLVGATPFMTYPNEAKQSEG